MIVHDVGVHREADRLERQDQLAWKIAEVTADPAAVEPAVAGMIVNRVIDNASVAIAAINRDPVMTARDQALAHPRQGGATVFGLGPDVRVHAEWRAWRMARRCANSITMAPSWRLNTAIRATI